MIKPRWDVTEIKAKALAKETSGYFLYIYIYIQEGHVHNWTNWLISSFKVWAIANAAPS